MILILLENAIEAEKSIENPIIRFHIFQKAGYDCFKIENIVDKDVLAVNPELNTTKADKHLHGIGLI
ncbi:MAG: GHKL domain-containing protein [Ruminococcus sp.]|nr:GHKL domain-containing protein [Ruminococcus sp.]